MDLRINRDIETTEEPRHIHIPRPSRLAAQALPALQQLDLCTILTPPGEADLDSRAA
jgi:hypothetical protein